MSGCFDPKPVRLEGAHVRLEPLTPGHAEGLLAAGRDEDIWTYMPAPVCASLETVKTWIADALRAREAGSDVPYATVRRVDGRIVGSTRFLDIRRAHRGLEIGWTWLAPEARRTPINTEAKYLMLRQAFEVWGALRVQLKTDARNERSRAAIARIGGVFEGVLRKQMVRAHDGYQRDSAMFSITDAEWPAAKARLETLLGR